MSKDEAEIQLLPQESKDRTSTCWKLWKLLTLFAIFGIISVWIIFTMFPSMEVNSRKKTNQQKTTKTDSSCELSDTSTVSSGVKLKQWSGFEEIAPGTLIYSAYFDNTTKTPYIRLIAVSETFRPPKILCHLFANRKRTQIATFHLVDNHKNRRHAAFIVSCELLRGLCRVPKTVSISAEYDYKRTEIFTFHVGSTTKSKDTKEYAVCVPPLFGDEITLTNFIEFIELNRILGASKFYIYDEYISDKLSKAVGKYQKLGVVMVMPWNLPHYMNDFFGIHYHGQLVAIQDCLYRNRGKARWVGFHDFDEFLVPLKQPTIPSLLKTVYNYEASGFCIRSVLLPKNNVFTAEDSTNKTLITQQFVLRTKKIFPKKIRSKCIVDPMKVFEMGIHFITKPVYANYLENWIDPQDALVFHYRNCVKFFDLKEACRETVEEGFMFKYKKELTKNVDKIIRMVS